MSRKSWARLMGFCRFGSEAERASKFRHLFFTHHRDADELVHATDGEPLAAVYFTHDSIHRIQTKAIMRSIQERVLYANEQEDTAPESVADRTAEKIVESLPLMGGCAIMDPFHIEELRNKIVAALVACLKGVKP